MKRSPGTDRRWPVERKLPVQAIGNHRDLDQLAGAAGVEHVEIDEHVLTIVYHPERISLEAIFDAVEFDSGSLSFFERLRWAAACYRESVQREDLKYAGGWDNIVQRIYVAHYARREAGRLETRRRQWAQSERRRALQSGIPAAPEENNDG
jgi:hypothetical protein